jgi:DNA-binding response OmpR family regulator
VPARSKSINTDVSQPSIVVLEEYDALAAALSSALKKFAPHHNGAFAGSLKEVEKLAGDLGPELFIFDVDPPWAGITKMLEQLRDSHPEARVLIIGAPIPQEIAAERGSFGALQFVEKPFDLAAFGAAVQALLGPWRESEPRGTFRALSVIDALLLHCAAEANVILEVRSRSRTGEIHVAGGQVSHAETGKLKGEDAFAKILSWSKVDLGEKRITGSPRRTIGPTWAALAVEALSESRPEVSEPRPPPHEVPSKAGKKIVVIDDTEMLLILVEDVLATAEPEWQITTARSGTQGLREIARVVPDLVLLDYSLPDFNGDEVCRRLLENNQTAAVPVLMMSGHVTQMNATAARFENVVATIEKPFLSEELVNLVRRILATKKPFVKKVLVEPTPATPPIVERMAQPPPPAVAPLPPPPPPPPKPRIAPAPRPKPAIPTPTLAPVQSHIERHTPAPVPPAVRVRPADGSSAVLGLFLEVLSMQLTSQLQMGAIRARPASLTASLRLDSAAARGAIPAETGFQLGPAQFSKEGQISTLRLLPTSKPLQPAQMRNAFEIGGVALIPNESRARVQLTPAGTTPMTMELFAHLELTSVELTPNFHVAQLIMNWRTTAVRVTLNPKAPEQTAAKFEMRVEKIDNSGRIAELLLSPIK